MFLSSIIPLTSATLTIPAHTYHILIMVAVPWTETEDVSRHTIFVPAACGKIG